MHRFECIRYADDGKPQKIDVEISVSMVETDYGPQLRYHCSAKADNGRQCSGNADSSLEMAIAATHWYELDR